MGIGSRPGLRLLLVLTLVMAISGAAGAFAAGGRFHRDVAADDPTCVAPAPTDDPVVEEGDDTAVDDEDTDDPDAQGDEDLQDDQDGQDGQVVETEIKWSIWEPTRTS